MVELDSSPPDERPRTPLLRVEGISKSFPGVLALQDVSLEVHSGEVLGLVGENGAGKSTLMKILSGVYAPDGGQILLDGQPVTIHDPRHAQRLGISIIYQEFNLMPNLSVEENVFVGREPNSGGVVRWRSLRRQTQELLDQLGVHLDPGAMVRDLSVAEQQMVEIAKALSLNARLVIMDEPTSALTDTEVTALMAIIKGLRARGLAVIYISHRLEEIFTICDRVTVLRDGQLAGDLPIAQTTPDRLVRLMVGRPLGDLFRPEEADRRLEALAERSPAPILEVRGLGRTGTVRDAAAIVLDDVTFNLRPGEIVGLAGLVGSGRTEIARAIFGADDYDRGEIVIEGSAVRVRSPRDAIRRGIGLVPEDRKLQALVLKLAIRENLGLSILDRLSRFGVVRLGAERALARQLVQSLRVRTPSIEQKVLNLSGGNQQKVVIAKWLALHPKILIMDEPTRGIDIGAKAEVHGLMHQLAADGVAILMISSELPEILGMSDRVLVMRQGRIAGELARSEATQEAIMALATGVAAEVETAA
ncbi:MAG: inositol transport system ATP-binding protein [Thermomicrobiales bacterium]|nr:inositol transport system ATP-binding protein [Thermomicrobiales bacterium]